MLQTTETEIMKAKQLAQAITNAGSMHTFQ